MKILILPSWYPPDGGSFFREQSEAIAKGGIKIDVLSVRIKGIKNINKIILNKKLKKSHENGIKVYRSIYFKYPLTEKHNIIPWSKKVLQLFEDYVKAEGMPDLIHVHSSLWAGYAAAIIAQKYNIPYVLTEHRSRFVENNIFAKNKIKSYHKGIIAKALRNATKVIVVSNKLKNVLFEIEPSIKNRTVIIPNFIDTSVFKPANEPPALKPFVFFSLGNIIYTKGIDVLIEAFNILKKKNTTSVILKIGGSGKEKYKLKKRISQLGLEDEIYFPGKLSRKQVVSEMQKSHAFVLASRFEAFGVVLIEAMSCGLPVIASKSGGPEEIVNNSNGYLTALESPHELAKAMESMLKNYHLFNPSIIRQHVLEKYSEQSTVKQIIKLYKEVIE